MYSDNRQTTSKTTDFVSTSSPVIPNKQTYRKPILSLAFNTTWCHKIVPSL